MAFGLRMGRKAASQASGKLARQMENDEKLAYANLCKYARDNGYSIVIWHKHFGMSIVFAKTGVLEAGKMYKCIYEQMYDILGKDGKIIKEIRINEKRASLSEVCIMLDLETGVK